VGGRLLPRRGCQRRPAARGGAQGPLRLTEQEVSELVAFLQSLTDTAIDPALLGKPATPGLGP
jgi:hypothetical protein